jgi:hypothetical protein
MGGADSTSHYGHTQPAHEEVQDVPPSCCSYVSEAGKTDKECAFKYVKAHWKQHELMKQCGGSYK